MEIREITTDKDCPFCRGNGCEECKHTRKFSYIEVSGPVEEEDIQSKFTGSRPGAGD